MTPREPTLPILLAARLFLSILWRRPDTRTRQRTSLRVAWEVAVGYFRACREWPG